MLSQVAGKPVRVQFSRADEHGWDNFGPAHLGDVRAAADANGRIVAYEYHGWQHVWSNVETSEQLALGTPPAESADGTSRNLNRSHAAGRCTTSPNLRLNNHRVPGIDGYLKASACGRRSTSRSRSRRSRRSTSSRTWRGSTRWSSASATCRDPRWLGVLDAVAKAATGRRVAASARVRAANVVTGRGIGLGTHMASYGAAIADVRGQQGDRRRRRDALVRRDRRRSRRQSRGRREPDQRTARAGREPHC